MRGLAGRALVETMMIGRRIPRPRDESPARYAIDAWEDILQGGRLTREGIGEARRRGGGTLGRYGRRVLGRRDTQKGDSDDRRDHWRWCV